jgi:NAD-dependent SIR2 family protein deacetylase
MNSLLAPAAKAIAQADALVIAAGAGMGVDSGLPDFRGVEGFWRAYPPLAKLGLNFSAMANPQWFQRDPALAWGFYGHRLNLYRATRPHEGFGVLRRWAERMPRGAFVFTSNVDGQFTRAGFDPNRIVEAHGAIDFLQCTRPCRSDIFPAEGVAVRVDESTLRAERPLPTCPQCGALARPNILMFGDYGWDSSRTEGQSALFSTWRRSLGSDARLVVVECGAGMAIPTVRAASERLVERPRATLIRINVREPEVPDGHIGLAMGARDALLAMDEGIAP